MSAERRAALRAVKLQALVRDHWPLTAPAPAGTNPQAGAFPGGATAQHSTSGRGWVLIDDGAVRSFGAALAWARGAAVQELHVLVDDGPSSPDATALVARRASLFRRPAQVWQIRGRSLQPASPTDRPADASGTQSGPPPGDSLRDTELAAFVDLFRTHEVEPVFEHGALLGEVLGLEVARVVLGDHGWQLVVGVGHHDREARAGMTPDMDPVKALDQVATVVRSRRKAGEARHPANTLAPERWLRAVIMSKPTLVGAHQLAPLPLPLPRHDLRLPAPAPAGGRDPAGTPVVVVCTTGVDVDLVPTAADVRWQWDKGARLLLVMPDGDDYPLTRELAGALADPAEVITVPKSWAALM